jgi:hypothetical protein
VPQLTKKLLGKLFADKGYIGKQLAQELLRCGLTLFTRMHKNMKALPLALPDKILLNARNMAETIIGRSKQFSALNLPKHRLPLNAFLRILAAVTAYQINPIKPTFKSLQLILMQSLPENSLSGLINPNPKVRRAKALVHSGWKSRPGTGSFRPVTIEAVVEVTKPLKPSVQRVARATR